MKAYIQNTHTSGLGDLYTDVYAYVNFANFLRNNDYECHLLYVPPARARQIKNFYLSMFDKSVIEYFDSYTELSESITSNTFNGTIAINTPSIYSKSEVNPGLHHWDIFVDNKNFLNLHDSKTNIVNMFLFDSNKIYNNYHINNLLPIIPKLNSQILENSKSFLNKINKPFIFFHLRFSREEEEISKDVSFLNRINEIIKEYSLNYNIMLGSSSKFISNYFKHYKNVYIYSDNINDPTGILSDLSEMACIPYADKIIAYNELSWISNYLFYGKLHNKSLYIETVQL